MAADLEEPYGGLQYVYIKDMQALANFKTQIIETFTAISMVVSLILAVLMLCLLVGLTRPFRKLNTVAAEISEGHYDKRVTIKSRDEVGDFAASFNLMADHIEEHIAALSRMTESKQNFIDNLAHEIRTPVTAIIGYGELLKYANCSEEEKERAVDHIISQGKRIQSMSGKLLDLAYMGNEHIEMLPLKLENILAEVKAAIDHRLREKGIDIDMELPPLNINGDEELLKSLFINVLDNAVNASAAGGAITVRARREAGGTAVEIIDRGQGMDESEIERISEPFYRVDKSRSRSNGGAGLGLALAARICQLHKASLDIFSEPGQGATVRILFTTTQ